MKKFMKTCGILALIMVLAGIVMTSFAGIIKGPEVISAVKNSIVNGISQLDSGVRFDVETDMNFDENVSMLKGSVSQTFSAADIQELDAEVGTCQLNILPSQDGDFHVDVENAGTYQGYVSDKTLHLKAISSVRIGAGLSDNGSEIKLNVQTPGCEINLYVPEDFVFEQVTLSLGAGAIASSASVKASELELELAAGEIEISNFTADILNAEVGAGSLLYRGAILQSADVECGMGEIELELDGIRNDFNYDVEVAAGDVTIGSDSFGGLAGERKIDNQASKNINVECAMGSVSITFAQ